MSRFERWSVWLTTAGTLVTGVVYWWMKDVMTSSEPWSIINHPLQPWVLKAHILLAPLLVFSVGLITTRHVWRHYRSGVGRGRRTGIVAAAVFVAMVASGYLIQVITTASVLRILAWAHLGLGLVYSGAVAAHWPATRRAASARPHPTDRPSWPAPGAGGAAAHDRRRRSGRDASGRGAPARG